MPTRGIRRRSQRQNRAACGFRCGPLARTRGLVGRALSGAPGRKVGDMTGPQAGFERRLHGALEAAPSRIPVVLGGCGTGRTWMLQRVRERVGRSVVQYIDVERCATTPERFFHAVTAASPFPGHGQPAGATTAREAFDALLAFFD